MLCLKRLGIALTMVIILVFPFDMVLAGIDNSPVTVSFRKNKNVIQIQSVAKPQEGFGRDNQFVTALSWEFDLDLAPSDAYNTYEWDIFNNSPNEMNSPDHSVLKGTAPGILSLLNPMIVNSIRDNNSSFGSLDIESSNPKKKLFKTEEKTPKSSFTPVSFLLFTCALIGLISIHRHLKKFN